MIWRRWFCQGKFHIATFSGVTSNGGDFVREFFLPNKKIPYLVIQPPFPNFIPKRWVGHVCNLRVRVTRTHHPKKVTFAELPGNSGFAIIVIVLYCVVLSDEQMSNRKPFFLLNDEQRVATRWGWFAPASLPRSIWHLFNFMHMLFIS